MQIRYDHGADAVLTFKIRRHDEAGVAINPPVLEMVDERNGERWRLTRQDAMRLRDYIGQM
jgi:hypothetical protein